jgi:putative acyl-CoA dehydrogenase
MSTVARPEADTFATHEVRNQVPPMEGRNLFLDNTPLVEGLAREGGEWAHDRAVEVGAFWGGEPQQWGFEANENPPVLHTHDRFGNRLDSVTFHPAWHQLMARGVADEMHALPWNESRPGAHVARAAIYMSGTQAEAGFGCPITMTFAAVPSPSPTSGSRASPRAGTTGRSSPRPRSPARSAAWR